MREAGLFPTLFVFPGVALATLLPLEKGRLARWALGLAFAPFVAGGAAWLLMAAGLPLRTAALAVAVAATAAWTWTEIAVAPRADAALAGGAGGTRFAWAWAVGAALVVGLVLFSNPWLRMRGDAYVHVGIVWDIVLRGIPPEDPRFAGLLLNYVWFYNYAIALATVLRGGDPFDLMALSNVASAFVTVALGWLIGRRAWNSTRAADGAAVLMAVGFNAAMWLTWPLRFLKAITGSVRGGDELPRLLAGHWNETAVIKDLGNVFGYTVSFLDKLLHGTAINVAYAALLAWLWAMTVALGTGDAGGPPRRTAAHAWGAAAACAMLLFHGVVGLSAIPVGLAALGVAWLAVGRWAWLPARSRLVAFAAATAAGALVAAPYTVAIARAWPAAQSGLRHSYLRPDPVQWVTLASALALAGWFARRAPARLRAERRGAAAMILLFVLGMLAFAAVVSLPIWSHSKFVFEAFVHDELASWRRRFGRAGAAVLVAVLLAGTPLLTLRGYLLDRERDVAPEMNPRPGEEALYEWIRTRTPPEAVFVDHLFRYMINVKGRRSLYLGSAQGPELAAFPLDELLERRATMADLYGPGDSLDVVAARLRALGRPVFVLVRAGDPAPYGAPWRRLDARPDLFARRYGRLGLLVYEVVPPAR